MALLITCPVLPCCVYWVGHTIATRAWQSCPAGYTCGCAPEISHQLETSRRRCVFGVIASHRVLPHQTRRGCALVSVPAEPWALATSLGSCNDTLFFFFFPFTELPRPPQLPGMSSCLSTGSPRRAPIPYNVPSLLGIKGQSRVPHFGWGKKGWPRIRTPVGKLPSQVFSRKGHHDHGQQQLYLLQALLPLALRVRVRLRAQHAAGNRGQGIEVVVVVVLWRGGRHVGYYVRVGSRHGSIEGVGLQARPRRDFVT